MSFAIFYGSDPALEASLLDRLQHVTMEARHPLLLPGIFAEMELERHKRSTDASISDLEVMLHELDTTIDNANIYSRDEIERRNTAKRDAWLDMTYLRNSIITWKVQLERMSENIEELTREDVIQETCSDGLQKSHSMREITMKIKTRLMAICDEYDEKIRDCTMRLDGMAIATQWVCSYHSRNS
jgi:hypothetical protein